MKKYVLGIVVFAFIVAGCSSPSTPDDRSRAIAIAQRLYQEAKANNESFESGPCLSNVLIPNWVVDIAHNPRNPAVDDDPTNQCSSYREGIAQHFVELDPNGTLIRAQ